MARSLDDLIRFLLDEIALCGQEGASIADLLRYLDAFYDREARADAESSKTDAVQLSVSRQTIDRAFQEKVWKWLTRHPDVYAGKHREGNKLSLAEAEALTLQEAVSGRSNALEVSGPVSTVAGRQAKQSSSLHDDPVENDDAQPRNSDRGTIGAPTKAQQNSTPAVADTINRAETEQGLDNQGSAPASRVSKYQDSTTSKESQSLRVYVSEERIWYAATGHARDLSRVPRLDFVLLSIIAARRVEGILQFDLSRVSGQDKRSVPERTQRLHDRGYIEKKKVQVKGQVTSLLTLSKFVSWRSKTALDEHAVTSQGVRRGNAVRSEEHKEGFIDVNALVREMFDLLQEHKIVTHLDLKRKLGFIDQQWYQRILAKTIRKLEVMGCLRRIKAESQYSRPGRIYHRCIKFIREPENEEWQLFLDPQRGLPAHFSNRILDDEDADADTEGDEVDEGDNDQAKLDAKPESQEAKADDGSLSFKEISRQVPQWTPDQNLSNYLFDLVANSGTKGMSTMDIKALGVGNFFRRSIEHQLSRLVETWQVSQPLHLRHLAIVRDTALSKTIAHYVHYSFGNFHKVVDSGRSSWEAVHILNRDGRKKAIEAASIDAEADLDEYGFTRLRETCFQGRGNNATLLECRTAAKLEPFYITTHDPVAVKLDDGTYGLSLCDSENLTDPNVKMTLARVRTYKPREKDVNKPHGPLGRPRKYPKGEERYKTSNKAARKKWKTSMAAAARYEASKRKQAGETPEEEKKRESKKRSAHDAELDAEPEDPQKSTSAAASGPPSLPRTLPEKAIDEAKKQQYATMIPEDVLDEDTIRVHMPSNGNNHSNHDTVVPKLIEEHLVRSRGRPRKRAKKAAEGNMAVDEPQIKDLSAIALKGGCLTYSEQAEILGSRSTNGVYIGPQVTRKVLRGRPPKSRLVVVRLVRLKDFTLFTKEAAPSIVVAPPLNPSALSELPSAQPSSSTTVLLPSGAAAAAFVIENSDAPLTGEIGLSPAVDTDSISPHKPRASRKRRRLQLLPESARSEPGDGAVVSPLNVSRDVASEPAKKRRNVEERESLSITAPEQGTPVPSSTVEVVPEEPNTPSENDGDAIQLLNDVMNRASPLDVSSVRMNASAQVDLHIPDHDGISRRPSTDVGPVDQALPQNEAQMQGFPSGQRELVDQLLPSIPTFEMLPEAEITTPSNALDATKNREIEAETIESPAMTQAPDASTTEAHEAIDFSLLLEESPAAEQSEDTTGVQRPIAVTNESQKTGHISQIQADIANLGDGERTRQSQDSSDETSNPVLDSMQNHQDQNHPNNMAEGTGREARKKGSRSKYGSTSMKTLGGGYIAVRRRKIIMDIMEKCGGVFPGEKELWYPFTTAWMKDFDAGKPDQRTIRQAVKSLIDGGKLKQLTFSFRDKKGIMVTKTLLATTQISPSSTLVKKTERRIIEEDPRPYIPPDAEIAPELRKTYEFSLGRMFPSMTLAVEKENKVELQYVPSYVIRARMNKDAALEKRRIRDEALMGKSIAKGGPSGSLDSTSAADQGSQPAQRRRAGPLAKDRGTAPVQRLARIQRPPSIRPHMPLFLLPTFGREVALEELGPISDRVPQPEHGWLPPTLTPKTRRNRRATASGRGQQPVVGSLLDPALPTSDASPWTPLPSKDIVPPLKTSATPFRFTRPLVPSNFQTASSLLISPSAESEATPLRQQTMTLMDPEIVFHPTTGTFSTVYKSIRRSPDSPSAQSDPYLFYKLDLPHRLEDITLHPDRKRQPNFADMDDPAKSKFDWRVDAVRRWELENEHAVFDRRAEWPFVNHTPTMEDESNDQYAGDAVSEIPRADIGGKAKEPRAKNKERVKRRKSRLHTREEISLGELTPRLAVKPAKQTMSVPKLKTRRLTSLQETKDWGSRDLLEPSSPNPDLGPARSTETRRLRGPQTAKYLSTATVRRILTAVVVVRTITGGLERNIDWVLINQIFEDQYGPDFIHARWGNLFQKNRLHVEKMQADFQEIFIQAYEDNAVPPIDYDNLQNYDWAWLVDWAQKQLELPDARVIPSLPKTRERLDDLYDIRFDKEPEFETLFEYNPGDSVAKRVQLATAAPFTVPLRHRNHNVNDPEKERLSVAKSWVRANIITPEEVYNPDAARAKLLSAGEDVIETALKELMADRILQQENKGRLIPGRNYDISNSFLTNLKKNLEPIHFRQALHYKLSLDKAFTEHGSATYSYHASDGDVLALLNLVAHRRVLLTPRNPPMKKFGLTEGNYKTRFMDKSRLNFEVDIRPAPSYRHGNPLLPLPPPPHDHLRLQCQDPPSASVTTLKARIPVWYDIHDNLVPVMWDIALAAVLACLALRPGAGVRQLARSMRPSLEAWEVELVVRWLVEARGARRLEVVDRDAGEGKGDGYVVEEWWWACLGE